MTDRAPNIRKDHQPPLAVDAWGWRYHHTGIPTTQKMPNEKYIPHLKFYVSGFEQSPFGIEWMRFDADSDIHPLIQKIAHVAFEVDDLEVALAKHDFNLLTPLTAPSGGVRVAMIEHNGAPIELIEFTPMDGPAGNKGQAT